MSKLKSRKLPKVKVHNTGPYLDPLGPFRRAKVAISPSKDTKPKKPKALRGRV
jgi:hypothetical protein